MSATEPVAEPPRMALPFRMLQAGFGLADRLPAGLHPRLAAGRLIAGARAAPDAAAREGLAVLLESLAADTALSYFGQLSTVWDFRRLLGNARAVDEIHREDRGVAEAVVAAPVFILGLPRSGTTFLHALLAEDEAVLVPRNWQTIYPAPRPPGFQPGGDKRARMVDRQLKFFAGLTPEFPLVHPIDADSPQECSEITAHVFQSLRFDTVFRVPGYRAWLDRHGHEQAFLFHKRFLQVLQQGLGGGRWILKCPDHVFTVDAILSVYQDARFVVVHRDPVQVFASVAHLTEVLRKPFLKNIDPVEIGEQVTARWIEGAQRLMAFDQRPDVAADRKIHLQYETLVANPMAAVARIYEQFGWPLSTTSTQAMQRKLSANPRGGYARQRRYSLSRFGINPDVLRPHFAGYLDYFKL